MMLFLSLFLLLTFATNEYTHTSESTTTSSKGFGVLLLGTEWLPRSREFLWHIALKDLAILLAEEGYSVYVTVFDSSEDEIADAAKYNVTLITAAEYPPITLSHAERLKLHRSFFPSLHEYKNIGMIIASLHDQLAYKFFDAARTIKEDIYPIASFVPILAYIPEDIDKGSDDLETFEIDILKYVENSKFVISVGPRIYHHFDNKFRALKLKVKILQIIPWIDSLVSDITFPFPNDAAEIITLDFTSKTVEECSQGLFFVALAIGSIADYFKQEKLMKWKIGGLPKNISFQCKQKLEEIADSRFLSIHAYNFRNDIFGSISRYFQQSHLHLFAPKRDPFGIISLISSATAVPTLSTCQSGFSDFLKDHLKEHYQTVIVDGIGFNEKDNISANIWKNRIVPLLRDQHIYGAFVANAQLLKDDLILCRKQGEIRKQHVKILEHMKIVTDQNVHIVEGSNESLPDDTSGETLGQETDIVTITYYSLKFGMVFYFCYRKLLERRSYSTKDRKPKSPKKEKMKAMKDIQSKMEKASLEHQLKEAKEEKGTIEERCQELTQTLEHTKQLLFNQRISYGIKIKEIKSDHDELASELKKKDSLIKEREDRAVKLEKKLRRLKLQKHRDQGSKWSLHLLGSENTGTEPGHFNSPNGLAWHEDQLVICDTYNNRMQILNKDKVITEIFRFDDQFDKEFKPYAVAISPHGHFFITDIGNNQIIICDQNKEIIQILPQSADIEVRSIIVMGAFIFVTDSKGKRLIKYNIEDGKLVHKVRGNFSDPCSVMATSKNHLLVSDTEGQVIHVLDSDLNFLNSYRNDSFKKLHNLAVDSHDNIYICATERKAVVKLRSDGQFECLLFESENFYPWFIAVNDDTTTTIAITEWCQWSLPLKGEHQIRVYSVSI